MIANDGQYHAALALSIASCLLYYYARCWLFGDVLPHMLSAVAMASTTSSLSACRTLAFLLFTWVCFEYVSGV